MLRKNGNPDTKLSHPCDLSANIVMVLDFDRRTQSWQGHTNLERACGYMKSCKEYANEVSVIQRL
jgi:hypothetical protein